MREPTVEELCDAVGERAHREFAEKPRMEWDGAARAFVPIASVPALDGPQPSNTPEAKEG